MWTATDLWVLAIFQGEQGYDALNTFYAMDTAFWLRLGRIDEETRLANWNVELPS